MMFKQKRRNVWKVLVVMTVSFLLTAVSNLWAQEKDAQMIRATRIIDGDVFNEKGEEIAEVDDVVIRRNGRIKRVTMEVGGFLDLGDKLIALPLKMVEIQKKGKVVVGMSQAQLEKKEEFDYYEHGLDPLYRFQRLRSYREPYYHYPYPGRPPMHSKGPYGPYLFPQASDWTVYPGRFLASIVLERDVMNRDEKHLGVVKDLIFDLTQHKVVKMVVELDEDVIGRNGYVAVPYKQLGFGSYSMVYDMNIKEIRNLPEYSYGE